MEDPLVGSQRAVEPDRMIETGCHEEIVVVGRLVVGGRAAWVTTRSRIDQNIVGSIRQAAGVEDLIVSEILSDANPVA
jgi:hypothetical protein